MVSNYELKRMSKKKINSKSYLVEGSTTFNLVEEHPSHKCMVMSKRKNIYIPCINSLNLLPNVADLGTDSIISEADTSRKSEEYAKIVLLLFYSYRI